MDDIHNLLCDLILKHESTSPGFVWGFQCSLLGSKIHYLGQEKSNSLHGSTQVVNIHYLGQNKCVKFLLFTLFTLLFLLLFYLTKSILMRYHLISCYRKPLICQSILPNYIIIMNIFIVLKTQMTTYLTWMMTMSLWLILAPKYSIG